MRLIFALVFCLFIAKPLKAIEMTITIDSAGTAINCIKGKFHGSIFIEQFRWNKWVKMDTLGLNVQWNDTCIERTMRLHSGENQFRLRVVHTNPYMEDFRSSVAKITNPDKSVVCGFEPGCHSGRIMLRSLSYWEIYDQQGVTVLTGTSKIVPIGSLPKGGYFLNHDNCMAEFFTQGPVDKR